MILAAYYRTPPQVTPLLPECDYSEYNLMPTGHAANAYTPTSV